MNQLYEVAMRNCDSVEFVTFDGNHGYGHKHLHKSPELIPAIRLLMPNCVFLIVRTTSVPTSVTECFTVQNSS